MEISAHHSMLPFRVQGVWMLVEASLVQEILAARSWVPIPGARPLLPGVMAWRGKAIAVLDVGATGEGLARLALGEARARTVVVRVGESTLALTADAVREVRDVPEQHVRQAHAARSALASREVAIDGAVMPIVDLAALLDQATAGSARA